MESLRRTLVAGPTAGTEAVPAGGSTSRMGLAMRLGRAGVRVAARPLADRSRAARELSALRARVDELQRRVEALEGPGPGTTA